MKTLASLPFTAKRSVLAPRIFGLVLVLAILGAVLFSDVVAQRWLIAAFLGAFLLLLGLHYRIDVTDDGAVLRRLSLFGAFTLWTTRFPREELSHIALRRTAGQEDTLWDVGLVDYSGRLHIVFSIYEGRDASDSVSARDYAKWLSKVSDLPIA